MGSSDKPGSPQLQCGQRCHAGPSPHLFLQLTRASPRSERCKEIERQSAKRRVRPFRRGVRGSRGHRSLLAPATRWPRPGLRSRGGRPRTLSNDASRRVPAGGSLRPLQRVHLHAVPLARHGRRCPLFQACCGSGPCFFAAPDSCRHGRAAGGAGSPAGGWDGSGVA